MEDLTDVFDKCQMREGQRLQCFLVMCFLLGISGGRCYTEVSDADRPTTRMANILIEVKLNFLNYSLSNDQMITSTHFFLGGSAERTQAHRLRVGYATPNPKASPFFFL
jgi:hypothetical protein